MPESLVIVGGGLAGLAAGIYGRRHGLDTVVLESHTHAGGQMASWKRHGYTFDGCIHHLMGCSPETKLNRFWQEVGAMPTPMVRTPDCVTVADLHGRTFADHYDVDRLERGLLRLAPDDTEPIFQYVDAVRRVSDRDITGGMLLGGRLDQLRQLPVIWPLRSLARTSLGDFARRFNAPFLRRAFPTLAYAEPHLPVLAHLLRHSASASGDVAWPIGGSQALIRGMVERYRSLGGDLRVNSRVIRIRTNADRAVGVDLEDGSALDGDYVISAADGRRTLLQLLGGRYMTDKLQRYCREPDDYSNWAVHVFFGVNRDLTGEPASLMLLLDEEHELAGYSADVLQIQTFGHDPSLAPAGKGVIKVALKSLHSYWDRMAQNPGDYRAAKERVGEEVLVLLEQRWPGLREQVEVVDVSTPRTWERYMGGTRGFSNGPNRQFGFSTMLRPSDTRQVPGLRRFRFAGVWATGMGATFSNVMSGRDAVEELLRAKDE